MRTMQSTDGPSSAARLNRNTSIALTGIWICAVCLATYFLYTSAFAYRQFDASTYGEDYLWQCAFARLVTSLAAHLP